MEFALTPKQGALRDEVREFLQQALLPESERDLEDTWMVGFSKEFSRLWGRAAGSATLGRGATAARRAPTWSA